MRRAVPEVVAALAACTLVAALWLRRRSRARRARPSRGSTTVELAPGIELDAAPPARPRGARPQHVVVVGAGIVGAATAAELTRRGLRVTVLEQESAAGAKATRCSWAWINANSKRPRHYQGLNRLAMRVWDALLPGRVRWCGAVLLNGSPQQEDPLYAGAPLTTVEDAAALEPALSTAYLESLGLSADAPARHFPQEGLTDPQQAVAELVQRAEARGAVFIYNARVRGWPWDIEGDITGVSFSRDGGAVEELKADVVVLANGTGVQRLAGAAGVPVPLVHKPGVLTWLRPRPEMHLSKVLVADGLHLLQRPDGLVAVGESKEAGGASSVAFVSGLSAAGVGGDASSDVSPRKDEVEQPDGDIADVHEWNTVGARMLAAAQRLVPGLRDARIEAVTRGHRPMPEDGLPVVGFVTNSCSTRPPRLYVAVCHSGITLGPMLGAMAALEVSQGLDLGWLAPYRPARFAPGHKAGSLLPAASAAADGGDGGEAAAAGGRPATRPDEDGQHARADAGRLCESASAAPRQAGAVLDLTASSIDAAGLEALAVDEKRGWREMRLERLPNVRCKDVSHFLRTLTPAATAAVETLSLQGLAGGGGRLPPHVGLLTNLQALDVSACGLAGALDRQLLALPQLTDLVLADNELSDLHTGGVLKGLTRLEVLDIRGNAHIFDDDAGAGRFCLPSPGLQHPRRVARNAQAVCNLERGGCVVLVDASQLRSPSCPCCK